MNENKRLKLLVADDHRIFIEGLKYLLKDEFHAEVAAFALNGKEAIEMCRKEFYDVVLMDVNMPQVDGISATQEIKRIRPGIKIIILSMLSDIPTISKSFKAGADGYVLKSNSGEELIQALRKISRGEFYISPSVGAYFSADAPGSVLNAGQMISFSEELITPREQQVLKLIMEGFTDQQIADTLFLSSKTVNTHRKNMLAKLNLPNTAALVKFAMENKLVS